MVEFTGALDYTMGANVTLLGHGMVKDVVIMIDNDNERVVRLNDEVKKGNVFSFDLNGKKLYMTADESYVKFGFDYSLENTTC